MKRIAVTGNIGCGKSYVMGWIKKQGYAVIDMDDVAYQVREDMRASIYEKFACFSAEELASAVFKNAKKREELEQMLYPEMISRMQTFFEKHRNEDMVFVELALLFEKHWESYFDEIWLVVASNETAKERLMTQRGYDIETVNQRMAAQMPIEKKKKFSDVIIHNDKHDAVEKQLEQLLKEG